MSRVLPAMVALATILLGSVGSAEPVRFSKSFEGASLGRIEATGENEYRCSALGQQNEFGRNRQPTWYYFRMDGVKGRAMAITLSGFIGEYNNKPAVAMSAVLMPMFSYDGEKWEHFPESAATWDDAAKEMTLRFTPEQDGMFIAHIQPYTTERLGRLMAELRGNPAVLDEVIGKSTLGRDLHLLTVTNTDVPDAGKKHVWLQARQHAWEAGTSWVMEGALRFITSDDPAAKKLRDQVVFHFTPMVDPDGVAQGNVRFNMNGFDVNRHWDEVDLRTPKLLREMPEIWYAKRAILAAHREKPIDVFVNMHNTETSEYLDSYVDEEASFGVITRLFQRLRAETQFDPSRVPIIGGQDAPGTANALWKVGRVPIALMELRIGPSKKLRHRPTAEDRLKFGPELIQAMAATALEGEKKAE